MIVERRARVVTAVVAVTLVGGGIAAGGARFDDGYARRFEPVLGAMREEATRPRLPADFIGLTADDVFGAATEPRRGALAAQQAMGVGILRQTFDWRTIERRRGSYRFRYHDGFVLDAAERGVRVLPILFNPPAFHRRRTAARGTPPPEDPTSMARFAAALVRRYGPRGSLWRRHPNAIRLPIRSWQIWNEPNVPVYWPTGPDAREYADMLATVAAAIKHEDPSAEIVSAGLPNSRLGIPFPTYMRELVDAGAGRWIDAFAIHPYARKPAGVLAAVGRARRRLDALGQERTPIWVTELGWASGGPPSPFTVGAARQARYLDDVVEALAAARRRDRIRGLVYFNWRDAKPYRNGRDFWGLHTGLLDRQGRRKPAFDALRGALLRAGGRR